MEDLTEKQLKAFKGLKERVEQEKLHLQVYHEYNDRMLLRYLRARKFDLEKSYKMFSDYVVRAPLCHSV